MSRDPSDVPSQLKRRLVQRARQLRAEPTASERRLWQAIRRDQLGYRFRRQQTVGPFIVDFLCLRPRFIIEVDGPVHDEQSEQDEARQALLEQHGYRVLRFTNDQVEGELPSVLQQIQAVLSQSAQPAPRPSPRRSGGKGRG